MSNCVVFVCDKPYFSRFLFTCNQLLSNGQYNGDICLVIGNDLLHDNWLNHEFIQNNKQIIVKHFANIHFPPAFLAINNKIKSDGRNISKRFQWHKLHLFNTYFKRWQSVLYIDCGMTIFTNISPILNEKTENTLLVHCDGYPKYEWKLGGQFDRENTEYFTKLNTKYNLDIDYFQTGMMLYDTNIIEENTFQNLYDLMLEYPICKTNEQGIISLYFTNVKPLWKQIRLRNDDTYFYDCMSRDVENNRYIMLKINKPVNQQQPSANPSPIIPQNNVKESPIQRQRDSVKPILTMKRMSFF